ncbi:hypothetical protein WNY37_08475 [Henriciella sp. AS95]|uniref:hypothetical protein n=1 Tax=Henriciella sp. AS95 TaxID=3135782 RepID=UPI00317A9EA8
MLFNSLLLLLVVLGTRVLTNAYTAESVGDVPDIQARNETRKEIDAAFQTIVPKGNVARAFWADQIARELGSRDFSAARGYLLAAPVMLERDDSRAILAAADAEESGSQDQRLTKAALLFLPNEVRASYQRAIEPPRVDMSPQVGEEQPVVAGEETEIPPAEDDTEAAPEGAEVTDGPDEADTTAEAEPTLTDAPRSATFSMVGDRTDLVRRSQRWVNNESVNSLLLRLSAISLIKVSEDDQADTYAAATSVLRAASRANRLTVDYSEYLEGRIERAMPADTTLAAVRNALSAVAPMSQLEDQVLQAYEASIDQEGLNRLQRDLRAIARISSLTSPAGAVTLLETAESPEDVRKLQLIAEAGGDRAVALTKQIGPKVIGLAQIGIKWSIELTLQLMAIAGLALALGWTALSAVSNARPVRHYRR